MKNLLLGFCLMLVSLVFGQSDDDTLFYDMYWVKTDTLPDMTFKLSKYIEGDPSPEFFIKENITKWDTIGVLSYISRQVIDSLNTLRVNKGLSVIINDPLYGDDEYTYKETSVFDNVGRRKMPLMALDFYYDMGECTCVNEIIAEITSHKDIMKRLLSKRNKVINVCVILDKKTNVFSTYVQVKRLFTLSYYIGD
jgi:hypothetical protein